MVKRLLGFEVCLHAGRFWLRGCAWTRIGVAFFLGRRVSRGQAIIHSSIVIPGIVWFFYSGVGNVLLIQLCPQLRRCVFPHRVFDRTWCALHDKAICGFWYWMPCPVWVGLMNGILGFSTEINSSDLQCLYSDYWVLKTVIMRRGLRVLFDCGRRWYVFWFQHPFHPVPPVFFLHRDRGSGFVRGSNGTYCVRLFLP